MRTAFLAAALLATSILPALADSACTTVEDLVKLGEPTNSVVRPITDIELKAFQTWLHEQGQSTPDNVTKIYVGLNPAQPDVAYLFGFGDDGCEKAIGKLSRDTLIGKPS